MVDCGRLEICCTETYRGFESLPLRQNSKARPITGLAFVFLALVASFSPAAASAHPACVKLETEKGATFISNACDRCWAVSLAVANNCGQKLLKRRLQPGKRERIAEAEWPRCEGAITSSTVALEDIKACRSSTTPMSDPSDRR